MNHLIDIHLEQVFDKLTKQKLANIWRMIVKPEVIDYFQQTVSPYLGMALIEGEQRQLADGSTMYTFELDDQMSRALKQAFFTVGLKARIN